MIDVEKDYNSLQRDWKKFKRYKNNMSQESRQKFLTSFISRVKEVKKNVDLEEAVINRLIDRIIIKHKGEMTFIDIARELDLTLETIKSTYKSSLKKIKKFLDNQRAVKEYLQDEYGEL